MSVISKGIFRRTLAWRQDVNRTEGFRRSLVQWKSWTAALRDLSRDWPKTTAFPHRNIHVYSKLGFMIPKRGRPLVKVSPTPPQLPQAHIRFYVTGRVSKTRIANFAYSSTWIKSSVKWGRVWFSHRLSHDFFLIDGCSTLFTWMENFVVKGNKMART